MKTPATREQWLHGAIVQLRAHFAAKGWSIPERVRVSCGFPSSGAFGSKRATGETWSSQNSRDKHFEVFISPTIDKPVAVLANLAHELVHVTVGLETGHRGHFITCGQAIGLAGPWTATHASDELALRLHSLAESLGDYPHRSLDKMTNAKKKQGTRLIKCACLDCTYTVRCTMKWILVGAPLCGNPDCPSYRKPLEVDIGADDKAAIAT